MDDALFQSLRGGATLVAKSHRQSRTLQLRYAERMLGEGCTAWPTPDIVTWEGWLQRCWADLQGSSSRGERRRTRVLLSTVQEASLWETIVRSSHPAHALLQVETTAAVAAEAWRLSWEWSIAIPTPRESANGDIRAFSFWAREFDDHCRNQDWQDRARLADVLAAAFRNGEIEAPRDLVLYGFDELTPQQTSLFDAIRKQGATVGRRWSSAVEGIARRCPLRAAADEIVVAAQWARRELEAGNSRIGIVIPDLAARRTQVIRIFDDVFLPQAVLAGGAAGLRPYNVSLGLPLSGYPLISTALKILDLGVGTMPCEEMGSLLRSPFVGGSGEERIRRALLDVVCRAGEPFVNVDDVVWHAQRKDREGKPLPHFSPGLAARLRALLSLLRGFPPCQPASDWAEGFAEALKTMGWPGDRSPDSAEYQQTEAWRELLGDFSSLDRVCGSMDYRRAIRALRAMAARRIFQPQSPEVPIQIMGLLEATALTFDRLWIAGLHDGLWPQSPSPNPFIDLRLQRAKRLPHSGSAREYEFARDHTVALLSSAPEVVVSSPLRHLDEDLRPSPLIAHLPLLEIPLPDLESPLARLVHEGRPVLEEIADERASAIPDGQKAPFGTRVFQDQAACPFRAFAHVRLGAHALGRPQPGLDGMERGNLLHEAMRHLWIDLRSHSRLVGMAPEALRDSVERASAQAAASMASRMPLTFSARFRELECARLGALIGAWLEVEKARPPFVVLAPEQQQTASFGGVSVRIVPDRVDEIDGGARVVIDYKTGDPQLAGWFGPRPDEPQLPIYALAQSDVVAVAFARLHADEVGFLGAGRFDGIAPGIQTLAEIRAAREFESWDGLLANWRAVLDALGQEFRSGDARVAPKRGHQTCKNCDLAALCRIAEDESPVTDDSGDEA
ncbi:MAG: PD-(D/E)XK nuclease family protein [Acidiferrobacterales bacterium]